MLDIIKQTSVHRNFSFQSRIGLYWIHSRSCFVSKSNSDMFWSVSQQISGQGLYTTDIFLLVQTTVFMRARVHVRLMANEGRIPLSSQRQSWQPPVIILWGLGLIWALHHGPQTQSTHSVGFFESFISTLRCQYTDNTHTVSILPAETSKPLGTIICSDGDHWPVIRSHSGGEKRSWWKERYWFKGWFEKVKVLKRDKREMSQFREKRQKAS